MTLIKHANGACWLDRDGNPIQAHGGCVLIHKGNYYWYGEGHCLNVSNGVSYGGTTLGINCYRSNDLIHWENRGQVFPASGVSTCGRYQWSVIKQPKVIRNPLTEQFVMWLHVESPDCGPRIGVAVADHPAGPFHYIHSFGMKGFLSCDQTLFQDDNGRAYHLFSCDENEATFISRLADDYRRPGCSYDVFLEGRCTKVPAMCKRNGRYYLLASDCTGRERGTARSAFADNIEGKWQELENPCVGVDAEMTFGGQCTSIIAPKHRGQPYIAMFDVWRTDALTLSGYTWLPIVWQDHRMRIRNSWTWPGSSTLFLNARDEQHSNLKAL